MNERELPLAACWQGRAAEWHTRFGWRVPQHFGDWRAEYEAARQAAAVFDLSYRTTLRLTGCDRASFLHNFCTNDILRTPIGCGCEAFLTTAQAKVLAWFHAFIDNDAIYLDADAGRGPVMVQHLSRYQISEDVVCEDLTGQVAVIHVSGPQAESKLADILECQNLPQDSHRHIRLDYGGQALQVRRLTRFGVDGWDLVGDAGQLKPILVALLNKGVVPAGDQAVEVLRVEAGWPLYGVDMDETNLPQELGRDDRAISFTKGCYLGQETVARIRAYGHVNRRLGGLRLAEAIALPAGTRLLPKTPSAAGLKQSPASEGVEAPVVASGVFGEIGRATSSVVSPRFGGIALAWLRRGYWEPGTLLLADAPTGQVLATVCTIPFTAT